jgi:hypothetical protein
MQVKHTEAERQVKQGGVHFVHSLEDWFAKVSFGQDDEGTHDVPER